MPNWDQATLVAYQARRAVSGAQLEPIIHHGAVGAQAGEGAHSGRVPVRITSYRRRLTDIDNLAGKYFLDACRDSKLISDDSPEQIEFSITQIKVKDKCDERTIIQIG